MMYTRDNCTLAIKDWGPTSVGKYKINKRYKNYKIYTVVMET